MSDNVGVNPGNDVGAVDVATDDILGIHHPFFKMEFGEDGTATPVSETNPLPVIVGNKVSTLNSTTTPLGIDGVFTGDGEDISNYAAINIMVFADQNSATDGLSLEWSSDNVNWDESETNTITANETLVLQGMGEGNYFRIVYTNGGIGQTAFRLHVIYKVVPSVGEVTHLDVAITDSADAQLTRSVIVGKKPNGAYENIDITAGGNLKASLEEFDAAFLTNPLPVVPQLFSEEEYLSTYLLDTAAVNMAVDGTTPVTYSHTVPTDTVLYLKRGFLVMEDGAVAFVPGNFGALAAITNGVSVGVTPSGGSRVEIENWKTNRQIRDTMFDFDTEFRVDGAYVGRWSFTRDLNEGGLVLTAGDIIDFKIQDDLTGLDYMSFRLKGILKAV